MTERHADHPPVSEEDAEILDDNTRLYLVHSDVQRVIHSAVFRYEKITLRRLTDELIQSNMETLFNTTGKVEREKTPSLIYVPVNDIVNQAVYRGAADNASSSRRYRFTKSQELAQNSVGCLMKKPKCTAPIT